MSAVVVAYRPGPEMDECLSALIGQPDLREIIIVDNSPHDESLGLDLGRYAGVTVIRTRENLGFAGGANCGAARATGDVLLFLNPDTVICPGGVRELASWLSVHPGAAGPPIIHQRQSFEPEYGGTIDLVGMPHGLVDSERPPLYVSGCCLATNRGVFDQLGGFDGRFFMFVEDVEYCWRVLIAGFEVAIPPMPSVRHLGGTSAPGGYRREGRLEITGARVALRERNTLAALLVCAPRLWLPLLTVLSVARTFMMAAWLAARSHFWPAGRVVKTLGWNVGQLGSTLRRRRQTALTEAGRQTAWARVQKTLPIRTVLQERPIIIDKRQP